jgi:probable phosphoglycerate mutase
VLLLRHGQTDANAGGVLQGWRPTPLNAAGHAQARRLAERLATFTPHVRRIVSSDLVRARQTAETVAAALSLEPAFDPAWRERGLGEMEGQTVGERETWRAASGEVDPAGAESVAGFQARAMNALLQLPRARAGASPVAVVTHGGTIRSILRCFVDGRLRLAHAPPINGPDVAMIANCSIMHLVAQVNGSGAEPAWRIECVNDVAHLDERQVSARDSG